MQTGHELPFGGCFMDRLLHEFCTPVCTSAARDFPVPEHLFHLSSLEDLEVDEPDIQEAALERPNSEENHGWKSECSPLDATSILDNYMQQRELQPVIDNILWRFTEADHSDQPNGRSFSDSSQIMKKSVQKTYGVEIIQSQFDSTTKIILLD